MGARTRSETGTTGAGLPYGRGWTLGRWRSGVGLGVVRHQLGFAETALHHGIDDGVEPVHHTKAVSNGADLHAIKFGIDGGEQRG